MRAQKITNDTELRIWCVNQCTDTISGSVNLKKVKELYAFVSASMVESMAVQKKPRECFFSRLCSKIQSWRKRP